MASLPGTRPPSPTPSNWKECRKRHCTLSTGANSLRSPSNSSCPCTCTDLVFFHRCTTNNTDFDVRARIIEGRVLRGDDIQQTRLQPTTTRSEFGRRAYSYQVVQPWNNLPAALKGEDAKKLPGVCKSHLWDKLKRYRDCAKNCSDSDTALRGLRLLFGSKCFSKCLLATTPFCPKTFPPKKHKLCDLDKCALHEEKIYMLMFHKCHKYLIINNNNNNNKQGDKCDPQNLQTYSYVQFLKKAAVIGLSCFMRTWQL
jgi:hypothetical protein